MKGMYNNGRWLAEGFTGLFFANTEYVNTSAGTFWIGQYANDKYSCEGLWSVTFYYLKNNSISREGLSYYSYGNPIDTKPTFSYCGDGYGYAYYAQYSGTWYRHAVSFGDYPSVTRTAIACPANTAKVWANSGYTYAYDGSAIYFYEGMTPSSAFDWTLLCNMTFTSLLQCAEFWTVVDSVGSSNHEYIFHKRFPLLQLSDSYGYSSDFSFPIDASNKVYIFFATKILCQIRNFSTSYAAGLLLLDGATGHCIDTESSLNDYIQSQSLTLCDGGTELLNLPAAIPDGMDFYRRMPVLYGEDKMIYSISSIDIEAYTRFDVSTLQEVDMPAVTAVPETVYISPDLLKVDNVDKLNSAWYIKNKTSLVATITPNAITAGVKTGNLEPLADDNTIGAITPYKAIRVKELIDLFPVGSIYMSLKNNDPAEIFGGQWDLLPSRFLYGGSSKGNYTTDSRGGASEVTLKTENMPSHTHSCSSNGSHAHTVRVRNDGNPDGWNDRSSAYERQYWNTSYNQYSQRYNLDPETEVSGSHSHTIGASGSGTAFSILPPYQLVNIWYRSA